MSADKFSSIWVHHWQVFFLIVKKKPGVYKTAPGIFDFSFRFQDMALDRSCLQNQVILWREGVRKILRSAKYQKSLTPCWRQGCDLGDFQISDLEINSRERAKSKVWETANFLYNFGQKPMQLCNFATLMAILTNFANGLCHAVFTSRSVRN